MTLSARTDDRLTLALDVDGVLLDPERAGAAHWTSELTARFGITRPQLRDTFFTRVWDDVINGRQAIETALEGALREIGTDADVEDVLECWFDADFVVFDAAIAFAQEVRQRGVRVVLATNQEHRRAAYLRQRLSAEVELSDVIYSAELGHQKHEPAFFELASERLGVDLEHRSLVVFVDDVEHNVEAARRAGWRSVHAAPGSNWIARVDALLSS
jgi:putative hydrolase of the HAD superfamily